jgi:hypothetical protein
LPEVSVTRFESVGRYIETHRRAWDDSSMKVDAWLQHPTLRLLGHEMFAPLLRWTGAELPEEDPPLELTLASMDEAGSTSD